MSDESDPADNDADKRPRIYGRAQTRDANIEVTVQGSEGESTDDLEETFDHAVDRMADEAESRSDDGDGGAFR